MMCYNYVYIGWNSEVNNGSLVDGTKRLTSVGLAQACPNKLCS